MAKDKGKSKETSDAPEVLKLPELSILREHRSDTERAAKLDLAASILEKLVSNAGSISNFDKVYELLFDVCDIINIQPDELKNRNEIFLPQKDNNGDDIVFGWETFDALGFLMRGNAEDSALKHQKIRLEAIKKILKDDLQSLLHLIQQVIDCENAILLVRDNKPDEILLVANRRFNGREAALQSIAKLQVEIEDRIKQRQDPKSKQDELQKVIKENALRPKLDNIRQFSQIVNNYYNLTKLEKFCTKLVGYERASTMEQKRIVLFLMVQIGEFVTNKKITNKIKRLNVAIPWDQLQAIRDLITHQEEGQVYKRLEEFIAGHLESSIPFMQLVAEFKELGKAVKEIIVKFYSDPEAAFQAHLLEEQAARPVKSQGLDFGMSVIPEDIQRAFLTLIRKYKAQSKLSGDEWEKRFAKWQELMRGNPITFIRLDSKEVGLLRQLFPPKSPEIQRYNAIVVKLSDENKRGQVSSDEIEFLEQSARGNVDTYRRMVPVYVKLRMNGVLSPKEVQLLQALKPTAACDLDKQNCERIIEEIKECVEQKENLLKKSDKDVFEGTSVYQQNPGKWSPILSQNKLASYQDLQCVLDFAASTTNPTQVNVFRVLAESIRRVWDYNWQQQMDQGEIRDLMTCVRSLGNEELWVKVLNKEVGFPTVQETNKMVSTLVIKEPTLVRRFIEIIFKLKPLMPLTRNFAGMLSQPTNTKVSDIERLDLAIESLGKLNGVVHANTHQDLESPRIVDEVHAALIRYNWLEKAKEDPKYARFLEKKDRILEKHHVKDHLGRLNPTPKGSRKLGELMAKMSIKAFDYKAPSKEEAAAIGNDIFQPYHAHYAPKAFKEREDFYYLTQYYLTIALVQLKELVKVQEVSVPKFIVENYVKLKKVRNTLIHSDYLNDSDQAIYTLLTKQICETVYPLNDGLMQLKADLIDFKEAK
jgi:uncharacterized protein with HEPN domain